MFIIEALKMVKSGEFVPAVLECHPVFTSESFLNARDKEKIKKNAVCTITDTFLDMKNINDIIYDRSIVLVAVKDIDPFNKDRRKIESYLIDKKDIADKDSLWTGDSCIRQFGYNFIDWRQALGYEICPMSMARLSMLEITCEIFCELTRFGFTEKRIKETGASISRDLGNIDISLEVNEARKKRCSDTWFSRLCDKIHLSNAPREMQLNGTQEKIITLNNEKIHMEYIRSIKS